MSITYTSYEFNKVMTSLRGFFLAKNYTEVHTQDRLSILAACEDPNNVATYQYVNQTWPLPQTGQMWLEDELLKNPSAAGFFCVSTSYRLEANPILGRHNLIFPMFEFETKGTQADLIKLERELCEHLGFGKASTFPEVEYTDAMKRYEVNEISAKEEDTLSKELGNIVLLKNFPQTTSPFWNMSADPITGNAKKVDVLIHGVETIGSAERSSDIEDMKHKFYNISNGGYAKLLFDKFGKDRVEAELHEFLSHDFFPRFGGGIGVTRLISALRKQNFFAKPDMEYKIAI
jgi:aspartyl/asparaginyl-tRNA synthetase